MKSELLLSDLSTSLFLAFEVCHSGHEILNQSVDFKSNYRQKIISQLKKLSFVWSFKNMVVFVKSYNGFVIEFGSERKGNYFTKLFHKQGFLDKKPQIESFIRKIGNKQAIKSIWIHIPMLIPISMLPLFDLEYSIVDDGFSKIFEDTQENSYKMWQCTNPASAENIPPAATHNLGVCGVLYDPTDLKIMLVKPKARNFWYFPGGHYEPKDGTICETALREVMENTGYKFDENRRNFIISTAKLISIISFYGNEFSPAMSFFFLFKTYDLSKFKTHPDLEIEIARWFPVEDIVIANSPKLDGMNVGPEIISVAFILTKCEMNGTPIPEMSLTSQSFSLFY